MPHYGTLLPSDRDHTYDRSDSAPIARKRRVQTGVLTIIALALTLMLAAIVTTSSKKEDSIQDFFEASQENRGRPDASSDPSGNSEDDRISNLPGIVFPTKNPTVAPSPNPSGEPTSNPSAEPSFSPSGRPTSNPSGKPTSNPSTKPSLVPTYEPTVSPTKAVDSRVIRNIDYCFDIDSQVVNMSQCLPHIIYVLVDDMGWNDVGYQSTDLVGISPHIDDLAGKGIKLHQFYSHHLCTPSRGSLLTGKLPINIGLQHDEVIQPMSPWGLNLEYKLLPAYLKNLGYETHTVGKWHLGHYMFDFFPTKRGFDSFFGFVTDQEHYYNHTYSFKIMEKRWSDLVESDPDDYILVQGREGELSTIIYRDKVRDLIEAHDTNSPFFLYYATQNVHGPLDDIEDMTLFTDEQAKAIQSIQNPERKVFAKLLGALDHAVSDLVKTLKINSMWDSSVLILSSDNGGCQYGGGYNNPLRGGKHFLFEGGIRVPAFITSPMLPTRVTGTTYTGLFHISDMYPTIMSMLQRDPPEDMDGISQWDALLGKTTIHPRTELMHNIDYWAIPTTSTTLEMMTRPRAAYRDGDMKLILHHWALGWYAPPLSTPSSESEGISGRSSLSRPENEGIEDCADPPKDHAALDFLFNISADPHETQNLINLTEYADTVQRMRARVMEEAKNMVMSSWITEDESSVDTWMMTGFVVPWMVMPGGSQ